MSKVIFSIFAGRRNNLELLFPYIEELYKRCLVDEIHVWDFTRDPNDAIYINDYINNKKAGNGDELHFKDGMIIDNYKLLIENNTLNVIYIKNSSNNVIKSIDIKNTDQIQIKVIFTIDENYLQINVINKITSEHRVYLNIKNNNNIRVKYPAWVFFPVVNKKSWSEYYNYYPYQKYNDDDVLIKCDDDIVYMDVEFFQNFINKRRINKSYLLYMPNIVNNGVTAYHQWKNKISPFNLEYETFFGKLVTDGVLATKIHSHFCENKDDFIKSSRKINNVISHPVGDRISINMFAILGKHFVILNDIGWDDEHDITVVIPKIYGIGIGIDMTFTVSHLGFLTQRTSGLEENMLRLKYKKLLLENKIDDKVNHNKINKRKNKIL